MTSPKHLEGLNATVKATAGAPTTGTWAVGDLVADSNGVYWRCTAGGTPGTWAELGSGGGLLWETSLRTASFTAAASTGYLVAPASAALTITLPASPSIGDSLMVSVVGLNYPVTIDPDTELLLGASTALEIDVEGNGVGLVYSGAAKGWTTFTIMTAGASPWGAGSQAQRVAQTIGDGVASSFEVSHGFATRDVIVQVYSLSSYDTADATSIRTDTTKVTVSFPFVPPVNSYRVLVL